MTGTPDACAQVARETPVVGHTLCRQFVWPQTREIATRRVHLWWSDEHCSQEPLPDLHLCSQMEDDIWLTSNNSPGLRNRMGGANRRHQTSQLRSSSAVAVDSKLAWLSVEASCRRCSTWTP